MQAVNNDFCSIFGARSFMTAMCVALDPATGRGTVVGAGHPPLMVARSSGVPELISSTAPPLGLIEQPEFVESAVDLGRDDAFILYTDGLFGGGDPTRSRLTPANLAKMLDHNAPTADALLLGIINQVTPNDGQTRLPDDLAAVAVRRMK
jgi:serine phosphatase RsbU (regulator of sigma subunit)